MDKPGLLFRAWTYHPVTNFAIVLILDISNRLIWLTHMSGQIVPHAWGKPVETRIKDRYEYRHQAAEVRKRHELIKYCALCDDDEI